MTAHHPIRSLIALTLALLALCVVPALALFDNGDTGLGGGDQPIARDLTLDTYQNVAVEGRLSSFSFDGGEVTYRVTKHPARGELTFPEEGGATFTYTPYENKTGRDAFTYVAEDADGRASQPATVRVTIAKPSVKVFYSDMEGHPAHKAAIALAEREIFTGDRIGASCFFRPDQPVTRQEFLAMAMGAAGKEIIENALPTGFSDGDAIAVWARPYVAAALRDGAVLGNGAEAGAVFAPDSPIRSYEGAVIVRRLFHVTETAGEGDDTVPAWAAQSVASLAAAGFPDMAAGPDAVLTRADVAVLLDRAMSLQAERK